MAGYLTHSLFFFPSAWLDEEKAEDGPPQEVESADESESSISLSLSSLHTSDDEDDENDDSFRDEQEEEGEEDAKRPSSSSPLPRKKFLERRGPPQRPGKPRGRGNRRLLRQSRCSAPAAHSAFQLGWK